MKKLLFYSILFSFIFLESIYLDLPDGVHLKVYQLFVPFMLINIIFNLKALYKMKPFEIIFFLTYFYLGLTFFWSIDKILSIKLIILEVMLIITYLYFRMEFSKYSIEKLELLILKIGKYYILGSIILYIIGIYDFAMHPILEKKTYFGLLQESILPRLRGFAESPNSFIPFALFFLVYFLDKKQNLWIFLTLTAIVASFSSTGMLIAFIILIIIYVNKINFKLILFTLIFLLVVVLLYVYLIQENQEIMRMINWRMERNVSGTGRFELWSYALNLISDNIFGYGINTTRILIHDFHALVSVHNSVLEIFLTGGFIALFLYLLLYLVILFQSLYIWRNYKDKKMFLLFIIYVLIGMANNTLHVGYVVFSLAILFQYANQKKVEIYAK